MLGGLALAVVILGGLFALMAAGGDGNPSPGGTFAAVYSPHTHGAIDVALFSLVVGVVIAAVLWAIYLLRTTRLARRARRALCQG